MQYVIGTKHVHKMSSIDKIKLIKCDMQISHAYFVNKKYKEFKVSKTKYEWSPLILHTSNVLMSDNTTLLPEIKKYNIHKFCYRNIIHFNNS